MQTYENIKLYEKQNNGVKCLLCPNQCLLNEKNKVGLCNVRRFQDNKIINPYSGIISSEALDPIEKKPLYHFHCGEYIYSIGFFGCTLKCEFCQNYTISQNVPAINTNEKNNNQSNKLNSFENFFKKYSPEEILTIMKSNNFKNIAFTYSEPILYYEWVLETARLCKENNINTVLVTNGYINELCSEELIKYIDAFNVDLKGWENSFYQKYTKGNVEPVKTFIKNVFKNNKHLEITTLVIPTLNDSITEIENIAIFIKNLSPKIPFHISAYHPAYKMNIHSTPKEKIIKLAEVASKHLHYVYKGNILTDNSTYCYNCGSLLISREYYKISKVNITTAGKCKNCGEDNYFIL